MTDIDTYIEETKQMQRDIHHIPGFNKYVAWWKVHFTSVVNSYIERDGIFKYIVQNNSIILFEILKKRDRQLMWHCNIEILAGFKSWSSKNIYEEI